MASHESVFRPLEPDMLPRHVNDDRHQHNVGQDVPSSATPAKIVSLQAYKVLRSLQNGSDIQKIHDLDVLVPLINEAHLRPVRFYRGLEEWLFEHHQDQA